LVDLNAVIQQITRSRQYAARKHSDSLGIDRLILPVGVVKAGRGRKPALMWVTKVWKNHVSTA